MPEPSSPSVRHHSLEEDIGFLAAKAAAAAVASANRRLREVGLRVRSYAVLALACTSEPRTQKEIAEYLLLDPSQVVSLLDELEREDLVRRIPDPSDRRARLVTGTPAGQERFEMARRIAEDSNDGMLRRLSAEERTTLLALLQRVV